VADSDGTELSSRHLWEIFKAEYVDRADPALVLKEHRVTETGSETTVHALAVRRSGQEVSLVGTGEDLATAFASSLRCAGLAVKLVALSWHPVRQGSGTRAVAYGAVHVDGHTWWGAGIRDQRQAAVLHAVLSAVNRARP
jgi:2-isopropylmalate synthase